MRSDWIRFVEHVNGDGAIVFEHVCKLGLEGIVSKRRDLPIRRAPLAALLKLDDALGDDSKADFDSSVN